MLSLWGVVSRATCLLTHISCCGTPPVLLLLHLHFILRHLEPPNLATVALRFESVKLFRHGEMW